MLIKDNTITTIYTNIYSLNHKKIGIPIFQRFYDWKDKEIIQFKEDLLAILKNREVQLYFLDFIYYEEEGKIKLADGQQRIVTLNILIKVIQDLSKEVAVKIDDINLFDITYDIMANDEKYQMNFKKYVTSPFKKVYINLYQFMKDNKEKLNDFVNIIKKNIFIFLKKCENADDAFKIFQQINTGGKPLSKDEVIKTALDQYSLIYQIEINTSKMKDIRQTLISYYKFTLSAFDKNFDNMEIITFLREYVTKDKQTFKQYVNTINQLNAVNNCPLKYVIGYINRSTLLDVLNILAMKGINVNNNSLYLEKVVIPLCMMSIVLTFNGGSPTTFKYLLNEVVDRIKSNESPNLINYKLIDKINSDSITWQISISDFENKLGDVTISQNIKKALLIIDVICKNVSGTINVDSINLEHIYPQTPCYTWAENGWPSHKDDQNKIINNIGNYLLLSDSVNKSIQNQYITQKVVRYNAIIKKDNILKTPMNTVDFIRFEKEQKNYIFCRQKEIAKYIQENLPLGKVLIKENKN